MSLFDELRRRKVFKVGATYLVVAWLAVQAASIGFPAFDAPSWALRIFILLALLGFPFTIVMAWVFESTPEGVQIDSGRKGSKGLVAVAAGLVVLALAWYFQGQASLRPGEHVAASKTAAAAADFRSLISKEASKSAFEAIEVLGLQKSLFRNQQTPALIKANEEIIKRSFYDSIKLFLESDKNKSIFELPDISNNSDVLEYTRWFFWVLFKTAKTANNFGKRVCVVLEEAHTIIPEVGSMGVQDSASKATINSIAQIALQGRKYNIGFIVIAQRTANVSKTVLTQCNSIVTFQELDRTSSEFLSNYMGKDFLNALPTLKPRTAIAIGKAFRSTVPMIFEVPYIVEEQYEVQEVSELVQADEQERELEMAAHEN